MKRYKIPAIVFGGGCNGLGVVRNLGRNGVNVYCVLDKMDSVIYSKFCKKYFIIPNIEQSESTLKKFLMQMKKKMNQRALLFPASDLYALHLSNLKEEFVDDYYIPLSSNNIIKKLADKKEFYQSLAEFDIPYPSTYFPESTNDVKEFSNEIKYPVFIKPHMSQLFARKFHRKGFVANSADELMKYYLLAEDHKIKVMLQEIIPGLAAKNIFGIEGYFDKNYSPRVSFSHLRLRGWPIVFGNTCLRESIPLSDVSIPHKMIINYLKHFKYHGLFEAEWKRDPRDGVFKLLEINPRQSMQNSLPTSCGINLILISYLDTIGEKISYNENYKIGIKWIMFIQDFLSIINTNTSIKEWIISFKSVKEWSYLSLDDLSPWIMNNFQNFKKISNLKNLFNYIKTSFT